ncbi:MAG: hypothetical protein SNG81_05590 [Rikenellaceae bacterium]
MNSALKIWISIKDTQYYETYYKLQDYMLALSSKHFEYELYKSLDTEIDNYKPTKEHRLESYFTCDNYETLKTILSRDIRNKRGKAVAMVLVALEIAGCKMIGDFTPLFENILTPIYGVCGSRQGVTDQLSKIEKITEGSDPKTAKLLKEMSEKYRIQLQ